MELDVVFLGGLYPKEHEEEIFNNSIYSFQSAANELQWSLVKGLDLNLSSPIKIINSYYIGSWPFRYKKLFIKSSKFSHIENSFDINTGFINLFKMTDFTRYIKLKKPLNKWANDKNKEKKVIISYGLNKPFLKSLMFIKKINPNIITCVIVPDLPQYMNTSINKRHIGEFQIKFINENLKNIDSFVLITDKMKDILKIKNNYVVVEGMVSDKDIKTMPDKHNRKEKIILYTGVLHSRYGIINLLDAFKEIKASNYRLVICGLGDSEEKIIEMANKDNRIEFKGLLEHKEILKLQRNANVLINPRQNIEDFTKYSFPSKNLEYLSSGTPMIAYKLDGIPDEYDDYILYVEDNKVSSLSEKIIEVCERKQIDLDELGIKAREFVMRNKNNSIQTLKIINSILK